MAPVLDKSSPLVTAEVIIAGVKVVALIDTGATSSCCRWGWYDQWKAHLGPLRQTDTLVIGVGNVPVELKGITQALELKWESVVDHCEMMVLSTLEDVDVILGMDIISRLDVQISGRAKDAKPQPESVPCEVLRLGQKVVILAGKSRVFFLANTVAELTLFEPSDRLSEGLLGLPTLSEGSRVAVQLDNLTEGDITLIPEWEVGTISSVHLTQSPAGGQMPQIPDSLSLEQQRDLRRLIDEYQDVFSKEGNPISSTSLVEHEIHTTGPPIRLPFRRQNPVVRDIEQQQVKEMLRDEVIRPSTSPWASPVVMVKKKDGSMRFCVDFRKMNDATIKDAHPLPRIDDTLESLHGSQYFTTLDLKSGYWQVPIKEEDKEKTAFRTSNGQLYEFNQLPFGLCNAPATFSRLMDRTLAGLAWNICLYYLDDIIVFSATWAEHLERLRAVFERLRRANLKLGAHKCQLAAREVSFLGYKVTPEGLEPEPRLMEAISKLPPPINVSEVRSFLGLVGYYRRFVKRFSDKAAPLNALLCKDQAWKWTQECQYAFETLKGEITSRPVSAYPDFSKPFRLYTDASNLGLGAILAQKQEGKEKIICCASRTLNNAETNYSTTKKECLAIVWGVQVFRPFLVATHFEILTDHYALQWLRSMKSTSAILHRWAAALEDYRFTILHRPGKLQGHVDALSRLPTENLVFTLEGKIKVSEEKAEALIAEVHRQGHLGENKTWKAFNRKYSTPQGRKKCREVVRTCPECQLGKDYKARHVPKGHCNAPEEIYKSPTLANVSWRSSEGSPIPVTSPLMPPKPARTGRKRYSWQNPSEKDVCMHILIFNPLEFRKEKKELTFKSQESTNCQHRIGDDDIIASSKSDVNLRDTLSDVGINRLVAKKRFMLKEQSLSYLVGSSGKLCKAYKGLVSLIAVYLAIIVSVLGGLTEIIRYERKSTVGNSGEFFRSESWRNVSSLFLFSIFHKCLNVILSFS